jgi:hypothetical protein
VVVIELVDDGFVGIEVLEVAAGAIIPAVVIVVFLVSLFALVISSIIVVLVVVVAVASERQPRRPIREDSLVQYLRQSGNVGVAGGIQKYAHLEDGGGDRVVVVVGNIARTDGTVIEGRKGEPAILESRHDVPKDTDVVRQLDASGVQGAIGICCQPVLCEDGIGAVGVVVRSVPVVIVILLVFVCAIVIILFQIPSIVVVIVIFFLVFVFVCCTVVI